jgi:post-segregation antitoxin (ccd killing protein)
MKPLYTEVFTLKISTTQKHTLSKLRDRNIKVSDFVRKAIAEKINRDYKELQPKPKNQYCPF